MVFEIDLIISKTHQLMQISDNQTLFCCTSLSIKPFQNIFITIRNNLRIDSKNFGFNCI